MIYYGLSRKPFVAPFAGAWIEIILFRCRQILVITSLPSRERGLKFERSGKARNYGRSLPSRERGLKLEKYGIDLNRSDVAPFAGAWIEIVLSKNFEKAIIRRSLRGSVD